MFKRDDIPQMWDRNREYIKTKYADVLTREKTWNE